MSKILVFLQQENGKLNFLSWSALKAARELSVHAGQSGLIGICLGKGARQAVSKISVAGLEKILISEAEQLNPCVGMQYAEILAQAVRKYAADYIVGASSSAVKDFFPVLAGILDCAMVSDVMQILSSTNFIRAMYAGNVLAEVSLSASTKVLSVRATSFAGLNSSEDAAPEIEEFDFQPGSGHHAEVVSQQFFASERPELTEARVVVSGGRGVQSKEGFEKHVYPLADALGAAIGASRAAVDAGFAPNDWQVGQTGKTVAPELYLALGISGAIQHLAGMKDSKIVVAINKDAEAPIFEVADYALVADLNNAVPALLNLIKSGA